MCNSVVALGNTTTDGRVIFGKNSDRETNEPHYLLYLPRTQHRPGSITRCTYIEIPQVEETYAVLLAKPNWIWGAEMAANEHGLVIGNTAVFTKVAYQTGPGLIGMDFLRLAVERTKTARQAVDLITELLAQYGQGGNDGFIGNAFYHNSFLIADHSHAWVLETAGKQWVARQVTDLYATSNALTIDTVWDLASPDLIDFALQQGYCKNRDNFSFKNCYGGPGLYPSYLYTWLSKGVERENRLNELLNQAKGQITPQTIMNILRDHGPAAGPNWSPGPGFFENTVCMHAGPGIVRESQTAGAMVSHLSPDLATHWLTGSAAPCTGIFKPIWVDSGQPYIGPAPAGRYNHASLWWRHESLHRTVLRDYATRLALYQAERDQLEADFITEALAIGQEPAEKRAAYSAQAFTQADLATIRWTEAVSEMPVKQPPPFFYRRAWDKYNKNAKFIAGDPQKLTHWP